MGLRAPSQEAEIPSPPSSLSLPELAPPRAGQEAAPAADSAT